LQRLVTIIQEAVVAFFDDINVVLMTGRTSLLQDYVNYVQFFGSCGLLCLSLMTLLHLNSLHNALGLYGTY